MNFDTDGSGILDGFAERGTLDQASVCQHMTTKGDEAVNGVANERRALL